MARQQMQQAIGNANNQINDAWLNTLRSVIYSHFH
jgi:hypothetical protein